MPINVSFLADYPDFLSFVIVMLIAVLLATGVKESSFLNNIFTVVNVCTVVVVIVTGIMRGEFQYDKYSYVTQQTISITFHCRFSRPSQLEHTEREHTGRCAQWKRRWRRRFHAIRHCWRDGRCGKVLLRICRIRLCGHDRRRSQESTAQYPIVYCYFVNYYLHLVFRRIDRFDHDVAVLFASE